ncbi:YibE/F-like protein [Corynebacterium atrinae]|uniref:YibE/F family protein n=1 Tax=Corynebacterium atrinae TaxID=1336740 RepID=UPI0025B36CBE|nr:YibE/F family protein [Corynebacterium atrinae]WJY64499.1 YibE/F-like protein [Corynebacterium atrinae]
MGRHSNDTHSAPRSLARSALLFFLASSMIVTFLGVWWLWPSSDRPEVSPQFESTFSLNHAQVQATVTLVDGAVCASPDIGRAFEGSPRTPLGQSTDPCQRALVRIESGDNAGKTTMLVSYGLPGEAELHEGSKIHLIEATDESGELTYSFGDYQRSTPLIVWGLVIAVTIALFAAWRGFRALIGLVITLFGITVFLIPGLLHGGPALPFALVSGSAILMVVVPLVHGLNWKSASALGGTLIALVIAAALAGLAIGTTHLRGLGAEDNLNILLYLPGVSILGLMLCGFVIGALGVLNDVTISQASTVNELSDLDPEATPWRLFLGAMKVGRDHISSMVYTLVLSYTGAALPMLLLISVANRPLTQTLTSDIVATELLRSGIGALALTLAVPLTTLIAAWTVPERINRD